jgi:transglutaminase-like putative cysteine protease
MPSPVPLKNVASAQSITYRLWPVNKAKLQIPANDNQTVKTEPNGVILVTVKPALVPAGGTFPYKGTDNKILERLKPTRYLQSDHKEVIALAQKAVEQATDAFEAAKKIEKFVGEYIDQKDLSVGYATAAEVAASRQGDCSEHAVLTAAMCRAVGIPAQVVVGLVYVERFGDKTNVFGPHAWVQVYINGKWIGIDPAQPAVGFNAGHLALATGDGDPEDFFGLINTLGYFKIIAVQQR